MNLRLRCSLLAMTAWFAVAVLPLHAEPSTPAPLPGDSLYQLDAALTDQDGRAAHFADGRGKPRLVSMFYSSCPYVCPLIIDTIRMTEHALPEPDRKRLEVLLVSLDAERDTPVALKALADKRHIDTPRWTLAHADAADVRRIAAMLDIQYRQLQNKEFSHSSVLVLLDAQGRIVARTDKLGATDPAFVATMTRLLAAH